MKYSNLISALQTASTNAGVNDFQVDFMSALNERVSKTYPALLIFPIETKRDFEKERFDLVHKIGGFLTTLSHTDTDENNFDMLETKLYDFISGLDDTLIVENVSFARVPKEASDKLIALKFSFEIIDTYCND